MVEYEQSQQVGVSRRESGTDAVSIPCDDRGVLRAGRIHDRREVVSPLIEDRPLPIDDRIRQADAATVEHDHSPERAEAVEEAYEPSIVLEQLHRKEPAGDDDEVDVPTWSLGVEYPVGDVRAVLSPRVLDVAHSRSLALSRSASAELLWLRRPWFATFDCPTKALQRLLHARMQVGASILAGEEHADHEPTDW